MKRSAEGTIRLNLCHIKAPSLQVRGYFVVKLRTKEKYEKMFSKCRLTALLDFWARGMLAGTIKIWPDENACHFFFCCRIAPTFGGELIYSRKKHTYVFQQFSFFEYKSLLLPWNDPKVILNQQLLKILRIRLELTTYNTTQKQLKMKKNFGSSQNDILYANRMHI